MRMCKPAALLTPVFLRVSVPQLYDAHELAWAMFFRDGRTGAKWMCPAIMNACCLPCCDCTQLRAGVKNGDAFRVGAATAGSCWQ